MCDPLERRTRGMGRREPVAGGLSRRGWITPENGFGGSGDEVKVGSLLASLALNMFLYVYVHTYCFKAQCNITKHLVIRHGSPYNLTLV